MLDSRWFAFLVVAVFLLCLALLAWRWAEILVWVFDAVVPD